MTLMLQSLQREVFDASGERILAACEVTEGEGPQFVCVVRGSTGGGAVVLVGGEGNSWRRTRSWPLSQLKISNADSDVCTLEIAAEKPYTWTCVSSEERRECVRAVGSLLGAGVTGVVGGAGAGGELGVGEHELGTLLEEGEPPLADAEQWVLRLADRLNTLDELNLQGMLAAEAGSEALLAGLERAGRQCAELGARRGRYGGGGGVALLAVGGGAALAERNQRRLLAELQALLAWLDAPELRQPEALAEASLATPEARARALAAAQALRAALEAAQRPPRSALLRMGGVRARLARLARARGALAAAFARDVNNSLIHLCNEAAARPASAHHADLEPYAPFMAWMKACEENAYNALLKVYTGGWARVYERELRARCDAVRAAPERDAPLDDLISYVEEVCDAEQEFCTRFFALEGEAERRRAAAALWPGAEAALGALAAGAAEWGGAVGAERALAAAGDRALGARGAWARELLAALAVAAKRRADRGVRERLAALEEQARAHHRRPRGQPLPFLEEFERWAAACERAFAGRRRADLERWYALLLAAMLRAIPLAERAATRLESYHRLHDAVSALRLPALDALRKEAKRRYAEALAAYVAAVPGPLEELAAFLEGAAEAVARGVPEPEVRYLAACSKHELRRVLARAEAGEPLQKRARALQRRVERELSPASPLLQVVWRALQERVLAQLRALRERMAACYPGAGLALPFSEADVLRAFDTARPL